MGKLQSCGCVVSDVCVILKFDDDHFGVTCALSHVQYRTYRTWLRIKRCVRFVEIK